MLTPPSEGRLQHSFWSSRSSSSLRRVTKMPFCRQTSSTVSAAPGEVSEAKTLTSEPKFFAHWQAAMPVTYKIVIFTTEIPSPKTPCLNLKQSVCKRMNHFIWINQKRTCTTTVQQYICMNSRASVPGPLTYINACHGPNAGASPRLNTPDVALMQNNRTESIAHWLDDSTPG